MKLYEFEGHKILKKSGIDTPFFVTCSSLEEVQQARKRLKFPMVVKVQVLSGKRGKAGGVKIVKDEKSLIDFCKKMFGQKFNGEEVSFINICEKVQISEELYASITYDTVSHLPFLLFSKKGGGDIEEVDKSDPDSILKIDINPILGLREKDLVKLTGKDEKLTDFLMRLWDVFYKSDARLVEVNPLGRVVRHSGEHRNTRIDSGQARMTEAYLAIDAKVILDENGLARHKDFDVLPKGAISAAATVREIEAKKIDEEDYRGSAGSTFIEFEGDIAVLASGGGASLLVMDAVVDSGGKPANYTEYSGNPPREKVEKLTKIALSREGLNGCLVAGAVANFTDIFETLSGFINGLKQVKPKPAYPIVIRRGGPRQKEAYEMITKFAKKEGFDIHLFGPETPISVACKKMVELSNKFKNNKNVILGTNEERTPESQKE